MILIQSHPKNYSKEPTVVRYKNNPIISNEDMPFSCRAVFNSTFIKHDGRYFMIARAEGYNLWDSLWLMESPNGYDNWKIHGMIPQPENDEEFKRFGRNWYDPRVTKIGDTFYLTVCVHKKDARMGLLESKDLFEWEWKGFITGYGYRNTVLFPEKINGLYAALERPMSQGDIWYAESPDLKFWGNHDEVLQATTEGVGPWGERKVGACGTPIKTNKGWLIVFHGVQFLTDTELYHTGVMLTELNNPSKIIRVADEPILSPMVDYENYGHASNVVFASSHIVEDDGSVKLYYGGADRYQCVADTSIDKLLHAALER
ncbi:MAG: hypothetical protein K9G70_04095 [Prolixibacteraceae bacterium]|nr:hypothetical protein [Prolixibacteraceae bacterium]